MLNIRQKKQLKARANTLSAKCLIGKDGLTENLFKELDLVLEKDELLKVKVQRNCPLSLNEINIEILRVLHCDLVQSIGRVLVFYRKNKEKPQIKLVK